ncbi:MAG: cell division protein ZapA, partial [SAR324 cluster bacterium]|nr:cell division protein ZapA [SAR324 cluster bacterium]
LMEQNSGGSKAYQITVNRQHFSFSCDDGENHVRQVEKRINDAVAALSPDGPGPQMSEYAMKIALLLADSAVRLDSGMDQKEVTARISPLLAELDRLTIEKGSDDASTEVEEIEEKNETE